ncbi:MULTISPECIES: group II intron reverse transcriptase/maturase [Paraburkholderia]|uniref:Group II intron reverse transcriptase/maturase n=1 Tax=Paraburkholderia podalyriae TaxID=1938811 RepID=A0ABR7PN32_9BURK|nr:group II intron reverse transcriptase/maturase [Paraburkholderia podalyriae]MBC8747722.1 group II intron reverse transcriptase/maturase [Paraburkholderia podalyriae]
MRVSVRKDGSALSHAPDNWHAVDWRRVERNVRGMQIRIAKATREGDWRRVKTLQRMLTRTLSAKLYAVRRVTQNQGARTAGVDRELWDSPESRWDAVGRLKRLGYKPLPLRRVFIPKANGKERPLGIPTMRDRAMQALYLLALEPVAESTSDPNSYGFRRNRSTADAMSQLFQCLRRPDSASWVLEADIKGCFDHISHDWLGTHVPMDTGILRKWLKSGLLYQGRYQATEAGTPQGGIISPTLANMVLNGLEQDLMEHLGAKFGIGRAKKLKVHVVRYADDFVITGTSQEVLAGEIRPWVEAFLAQRGLRLSEEKTRIVHIDDGFDFLGWSFRKYSGKLLIKPSKKNVKTFYRKVAETISKNKTVKQADLIRMLNPMLRGWAQYHHPAVAKQAYSRMDHLVFQRLWRWAKRRHANKKSDWIRKKYFHQVGDREWVLSTPTVRKDGSLGLLELYHVSGTAIRRHKKVRGDFHPFDPDWEQYGEQLRQHWMEQSRSYLRQWFKLYTSQGGNCAHCDQALEFDSGWHDHHLIYKVHGGTDALSNRVLLHPNCHRQVHAGGLNVAKPVPSKP